MQFDAGKHGARHGNDALALGDSDFIRVDPRAQPLHGLPSGGGQDQLTVIGNIAKLLPTNCVSRSVQGTGEYHENQRSQETVQILHG